MDRGPRMLGRLVTYAFVLFMIAPVIVLIGSSFTTSPFVAFPPRGTTLEWYSEVLTDPVLLESIGRSVLLALGAATLSVALSIALVITQQRRPGRLTDALSAYSLGPAMVPHVVLGVGLLFLLAEIDALGALWALLLAHVVICLPFAVRSVSASANAMDHRTERAAAILGAPPATIFWKVTVPALKPGIVGAFVLGFLLSFNNVAISVFISNSYFRTFPVVLFLRSEDVIAPSVAAISTIVLIATAIVVTLAQRWFNIFSGMATTAASSR